ncbi:Methyltransferase tpcH [Colletotrichum higginsianum]|uniref:Methyltransferase tpcH n=1 Tax=Colletotrichum higginsianum TaxID=80884 RepID=A0A4T0VIL9_9PEZI|nr:Methyltransferase tpcH [Colletotrichum higginsianum]
MVDLVKERVQAEGWLNTEVRLLDATKTGLPADSFTHIGLCMALNIIQDPDAVLADCKRILKPGGMLGATLPHPNGVFWTADMRSAFRSFPFPAPFPDTLPTQMHDQGHWSDQDWVINHLEEQGFKDVKVKAAIGTYYVKSAEHYVTSWSRTSCAECRILDHDPFWAFFVPHKISLVQHCATKWVTDAVNGPLAHWCPASGWQWDES